MRNCILVLAVFFLATVLGSEKSTDILQNGEKRDIVPRIQEPLKVIKDDVTKMKDESTLSEDEGKGNPEPLKVIKDDVPKMKDESTLSNDEGKGNPEPLKVI